MSISLAGIKAQQYIGQLLSGPIQIAGAAGRVCPLKFDWISYGGGSANQNIVVGINLGSGRGAQAAPLFDLIRSIYIDNSGSAVPLFVIFDDTNFTVLSEPYSVGWYPVFSNAMAFKVAGFGFTDTNVSQARMYVTNVRVSAYTDVSLQSVLGQALSSPSIGGGSGIGTIAVQFGGQDYLNGNLTVSGSGVTGCTAHGILDAFGRFTNVVVDTPGSGALGPVVVTPTGGQYAVPVFDPVNGIYGGANSRVNYQGIEWIWQNLGGLGGSIQVGAPLWVNQNPAGYPINSQVNDGGASGGLIYQAIQPVPAGFSILLSNNTFWRLIGSALPPLYGWTNSGTAPDTVAVFKTTLTANSSSIITSGFAPEALGDQGTNLIDLVTGVGTFEDHLFGTPFPSGFIYITHMFVNVLTFGAGAIWSLENALGYAPFTFAPGAAGVQLEIQKANIKLDATVDWKLLCTAWANNIKVSHAFVWTYSQQ